MDADKARLIELLKELSYEKRKVILASGRESDFYVDARQTTLNAEGSALVGKLVLRLLRDLPQSIDGVGGLTMGADPIATAASLLSTQDGGPPVHAFYVRKQPKNHGTGNCVEPGPASVASVQPTVSGSQRQWQPRAKHDSHSTFVVCPVVGLFAPSPANPQATLIRLFCFHVSLPLLDLGFVKDEEMVDVRVAGVSRLCSTSAALRERLLVPPCARHWGMRRWRSGSPSLQSSRRCQK